MKSLFSFLLIISIVLIPGSIKSDTIAIEPVHDQYLPDYGLHRKKAAESFLHYCNSLLWTQYAPLKWKQKRYQWDPNSELESCLVELEKIEKWHTDDLKPILSKLFDSTQDAHVSITFEDQRLASIPIDVDLVDGKVIVIRSSHSSIRPGDEIVSMNDETPLNHLKKICYGTADVELARPYFLLDRAFFRVGAMMPVPKQGECLKVQIKQNGKLQTHMLNWYVTTSYSLQSFNQSVHLAKVLPKERENSKPLQKSTPSSRLHNLARADLPVSFLKLTAEQARFLAENYGQTFGFALEGNASYSTSNRLDWGVFNQDGTNVGYLKIDDFSDIDFRRVDEALKTMEMRTDCLVIDIRNNPGGYDLSCFGLAARLTTTPLVNLMNSTLLDESVIEYYRCVLADMDDTLSYVKNDKELHSFMEATEELGIPLTIELFRNFRREAMFCIEEWENGYTCTRFEPLRGIEKIQPHPSIRYTKPLYILMDERCASCADIFPALLKDNHRATLLGRTTTGAGGVMETLPMTNAFGVNSISLTVSLLLRNNMMIIEDVGITPDFEHKKTVSSVVNAAEEKMQAIRFAAKQVRTGKK